MLSWIQRLSITVLFNCDGRDGACHTFPSPPSSILLCPLPPIPAIHPVLIHHGTSWDNLYPCTTPNVYPVLVYHDTGWDIALHSLQIPFSIPSSCTVGMGWDTPLFPMLFQCPLSIPSSCSISFLKHGAALLTDLPELRLCLLEQQRSTVMEMVSTNVLHFY